MNQTAPEATFDAPPAETAETPIWRRPPASLTVPEWESLCDGCGRCCLVKLEDEDTGTVHYTDVACILLDSHACRCADYASRSSRVPDCIKLEPETIKELDWLPSTCAYRLVAAGRDLMWWHPLVSGRAETVHEAGISVRGRTACSESDIAVEDLPDRIVSWPNRWPKKARKSLGKAAGR